MLLKEKQIQLDDEIEAKEEIIDKRRKDIIDQKRNSTKAQEGETIRRDVKSIILKLIVDLQAKIDNLS